MDLNFEHAGKAIGNLAVTFERNQSGAGLVVDLVTVVVIGIVAVAVCAMPFIITAFFRNRQPPANAAQPS